MTNKNIIKSCSQLATILSYLIILLRYSLYNKLSLFDPDLTVSTQVRYFAAPHTANSKFNTVPCFRDLMTFLRQNKSPASNQQVSNHIKVNQNVCLAIMNQTSDFQVSNNSKLTRTIVLGMDVFSFETSQLYKRIIEAKRFQLLLCGWMTEQCFCIQHFCLFKNNYGNPSGLYGKNSTLNMSVKHFISIQTFY